MSLSDDIKAWNETLTGMRQSRAARPYLEELARANRDMGVSEAGIKSAEFANAPQYYRGRAQEQENQGGLKGIELQFAPQVAQENLAMSRANRGHIGASTENLNFRNQNPLFGQSGVAGQLGSLIYLQNHPELLSSFEEGNNTQRELPGNVRASNENMSPWKKEDLEIGPEGINRLKNLYGSNNKKNDIASLLKDSLFTELKRKNAYADLANKKVENYGYGTLTADQKRRWIGQAEGMGVGANEAREFFNKGGSIQDLAEAKGVDPNNLPESIYAPTTTDITRAHFRQQAVAEIDAIQPLITEALAPYAQRVAGFSPVQIAEAIQGDNPDGQAKFLAAKALMPELSALRIKAMGGQVGIEAIREVQAASMASLSSFQGLVSPEVYTAAQQYMQEWINSASKTANAMAFNPERGQNKEIGSSNTNNNQEDPLGIR